MNINIYEDESERNDVAWVDLSILIKATKRKYCITAEKHICIDSFTIYLSAFQKRPLIASPSLHWVWKILSVAAYHNIFII